MDPARGMIYAEGECNAAHRSGGQFLVDVRKMIDHLISESRAVPCALATTLKATNPFI